MTIQRVDAWKPPQGTPIGQSGLARGLVSFWAFNEGSGPPVDAVTNVPATSNGAAWAGSPYGSALSFNGASQYVNVANDVALTGWSGPITIACLAAPDAAQANQHAIDCRTAGVGGYYFSLNNNSTNHDLALFVQAATSTTVSSATGAVDGGWHAWGVSMASTGSGGIVFYRDGQPVGTGTAAFFPGVAPAATRYLGTNSGTSAAFMKGPIALVAVWNRALSAAEHAEFARNPWQVLRASPYYSMLAPSRAYTLSASPGSFALAGRAAGLVRGRPMAAAAGPFTSTGQAAGLKAGRKLAPAAGAFALTGRSAGFVRTRVATAAPGSFALAGGSVGLKSSRRLGAAAGVFALSGKASGLRRSYPLAASPGSFTSSGGSAGLKAGRKLATAPGSFALAGGAATLKRVSGRTLTASSGAFALAGRPAVMRRAYRLEVVRGAFARSGLPAILAISRIMVLNDGVFKVGRRSSILVYSRDRFDGVNPVAATIRWWLAQPELRAIASDGRLWHRTAPLNTDIPYFTVSLGHPKGKGGAQSSYGTTVDARTTGESIVRSSVEIRCHHWTDAEARAGGVAIRAAIKRAPLSVGGRPATYVLPASSTLVVDGETGIWSDAETIDVGWTR